MIKRLTDAYIAGVVPEAAWCMDQGCGRSDPIPVWGQATRT